MLGRNPSRMWGITWNILIPEFHLSNYSGSLSFVTKCRAILRLLLLPTYTKSYCSFESDWIISLFHPPTPSLIVLVTGKASQEVQWCGAPHHTIRSWLFSRQLLSAAISFSANVTGYTSSLREFDHFMRFESSLAQHRNPKADPHSQLWRLP